ncbi:MAG: hypothetical protein HYR59_04295 [Acidobacteria bacterium]|nr:hypothetical protein [Acidobacteriota bacterium]
MAFDEACAEIVLFGGFTGSFADDTWVWGIPSTDPCVMRVEIDIKPDSFPNSINLGSGGTVPVAIFSSPSFDARTIDPLTVSLAGANIALKGKGTPMVSFKDLNGDGLLDMVIHVETEALQLTEGDTIAVLRGKTFGRISVRGEDSV